MGHVNLFGLVLVALGILLVFLGVTGRYQVFTGAIKPLGAGNGPGPDTTGTSLADQHAAFINGLEQSA